MIKLALDNPLKGGTDGRVRNWSKKKKGKHSVHVFPSCSVVALLFLSKGVNYFGKMKVGR